MELGFAGIGRLNSVLLQVSSPEMVAVREAI